MSASAADVLEAHQAKLKSSTVSFDVEPTFDLGLLTVYDPNGISSLAYAQDVEAALEANTRLGVQALTNQIFALPTTSSVEGIFAVLPPVSTTLPREKPLPKAKLETKWEKFAKTKGIAPKPKRDRLVFDEEKQDWVPKWGYKGQNKQAEDQWIVEVPNNKDPGFDPVEAARNERKARKLKNESQRLKNLSRQLKASSSAKSAPPAPTAPSGLAALESSSATAAADRKAAISRQISTTKTSTASLGRFDRTLDKEDKVVAKQRGTKRKFEPNEMGADKEREGAMKILKSLDVGPSSKGSSSKKASSSDGLVNARKAIRSVSKGKGAAAIAGKDGSRSSSSASRGGGSGSRGRGGSRGGGNRGKR